MRVESSDEVNRLIEAAERRMRDGVDAEIDAFQAGKFQENVETRKYEGARDLFEKALQLDPGNQRAIRGIDDCNEMLRGYVPVQYVARVDRLVDTSIFAPMEGATPAEHPSPILSKMPWDSLRERRQLDREGLACTATIFGNSKEKADENVKNIIRTAIEHVRSHPGSAKSTRDATARELEEYQRQLHRSWKGHGPEILTEALERLDAAFKDLE